MSATPTAIRWLAMVYVAIALFAGLPAKANDELPDRAFDFRRAELGGVSDQVNLSLNQTMYQFRRDFMSFDDQIVPDAFDGEIVPGVIGAEWCYCKAAILGRILDNSQHYELVGWLRMQMAGEWGYHVAPLIRVTRTPPNVFLVADPITGYMTMEGWSDHFGNVNVRPDDGPLFDLAVREEYPSLINTPLGSGGPNGEPGYWDTIPSLKAEQFSRGTFPSDWGNYLQLRLTELLKARDLIQDQIDAGTRVTQVTYESPGEWDVNRIEEAKQYLRTTQRGGRVLRNFQRRSGCQVLGG